MSAMPREQSWRVECLYDRHYQFVKEDGDDVILKRVGFDKTETFVRVKPDGSWDGTY